MSERRDAPIRDWDALESEERTVLDLAPEDGAVRGPMDLAFFDSHRFALVLDEGQVALLTVRGEAAAVYFSGAHMLEIGPRRRSLPKDGLLYVLNLERDLHVPWRQHLPSSAQDETETESRRGSGTITVRIVDPLIFHEHFLRGREGEGEAICRDALSHLLPSLLAIRLDELRRESDGAAVAPEPRHLDERLGSYGLGCTGIVLEGEAEVDVAPPPPTAPAPGHEPHPVAS